MSRAMADPDPALILTELDRAAPLRIELEPLRAFNLIANLQLALRHPDNSGRPAIAMRDFANGLIDELAPGDGALRRLLLAGFDPARDRCGHG